MRKNLSGNIKGSLIFTKIIFAWLMVILVAIVCGYVAYYFKGWTYVAMPLLAALVAVFFTVYIQYVFIKETINGLALDESVQFDLSLGGYFGQLLIGCILIVITLGLYLPWFYKRMAKAVIDNSSYTSRRFRFNGKGSTLFLYMIVGSFIVGLASWALASYLGDWVYGGTGFAMYAFMYAVGTAWIFDLTYRDVPVKFKGSIGGLLGFAILQALLTLVTMGLYLPIAFILSFGYVMRKLKGQDVYSFDFDGQPSTGFFYILLNIILTLITAGIYGPWAYAKITNWFANHTVMILPEPVPMGPGPVKRTPEMMADAAKENRASENPEPVPMGPGPVKRTPEMMADAAKENRATENTEETVGSEFKDMKDAYNTSKED